MLGYVTVGYVDEDVPRISKPLNSAHSRTTDRQSKLISAAEPFWDVLLLFPWRRAA